MEEEVKRAKWRIADVRTLLKNSFNAIIKGELLLRLDAGKYFIHICYAFFLISLVILFNLLIETSLARVETNRETIHEMEILRADRTFELERLSRRKNVLTGLEQLGSTLKEAGKPVMTIER